jgi:hypothetical protein
MANHPHDKADLPIDPASGRANKTTPWKFPVIPYYLPLVFFGEFEKCSNG